MWTPLSGPTVLLVWFLVILMTLKSVIPLISDEIHDI